MAISHEARRARKEEICEHAKRGVHPLELADVYDLSLASIKSYLSSRGLRWKKKWDKSNSPAAVEVPSLPHMPMGKVVTPNRPIWDFVNWEAPDSVIAMVLRVSRERIRQVRLLRGIAASPDKFAQGKIKFFRIFCRNHADELRGLHVRDIIIAAGHPMPMRTASEILRELGIIHSLSPRYSRNNCSLAPWDKMNWALPNVDLYRAWKIITRTQNFSRSRTNFQKGPSSLKKGTPEHAAAVDIEEKKAFDWLRSTEGKIAVISSEAMRRAMQDVSSYGVIEEERRDLIKSTETVRVS